MAVVADRQWSEYTLHTERRVRVEQIDDDASDLGCRALAESTRQWVVETAWVGQYAIAANAPNPVLGSKVRKTVDGAQEFFLNVPQMFCDPGGLQQHETPSPKVSLHVKSVEWSKASSLFLFFVTHAHKKKFKKGDRVSGMEKKKPT
jgi:hypothetical protein